MPPRKILCVAEKNSVAKAVAGHLGGGQVTTVCRQKHILHFPLGPDN